MFIIVTIGIQKVKLIQINPHLYKNKQQLALEPEETEHDSKEKNSSKC